MYLGKKRIIVFSCVRPSCGGIDVFYTNIEANYEGTVKTIKFVLEHKDYISSADFNYFGEGNKKFLGMEVNFMVWENLRHIVSSKDNKGLYNSEELEPFVSYMLLTILFKYKDKYMREVDSLSIKENAYGYVTYFECSGKVYSINTVYKVKVWVSTVKVNGTDVCLLEASNTSPDYYTSLYYFINDDFKTYYLEYEKDFKSFRRALATGLLKSK